MLFPLEAFNETAVVISGGFSGADATVLLLPIPAQIRRGHALRVKRRISSFWRYKLYSFVPTNNKKGFRREALALNVKTVAD
ncbi:MAG: hypothetical protein CVV11_20645 [Gammaproteobacteria bacterium HGW-Gammaproteobacteria-15]|nr:MAG: hypothetical protein CVV11_20645 [Gammaproteobacteria bacterium HGW-Gammaproteobacteria-15]